MRELGQIIAGNVRRSRTSRGLSIAELARQCGVAKATLSHIELGRGNPTIDTLAALGRTLGVELGDLLSDTEPPSVTVVRERDTSFVPGPASELRFVHRTASDELLFELYEMAIRPGRWVSPPHPAGVVEHVLVTRGPVTVGPEDEPVVLQAGDFVSFAADRHHVYDGGADGAMTTLLMSYPRAAAPAWTLAPEGAPSALRSAAG